MKVSILVPVYNVEKYIERCARSLFEQTYADIEYLFVDDCSPDHSIEVLKRVIREYPNREKNVRIIKHEVNRGLAAARNTAVDNCKTDFLFHIDSDDFLELDAIEILVKQRKKGDFDIVTGNANVLYPDKTKKLREKESTNKQEIILDYIRPHYSHVIWGRLIRKSLYTDNNIFAAEGYNIGEDHQVTPRLFYYANSFSSIDDCIYNYDCTNANSYTGQSSDAKKFAQKVLQDIKAFDILRNFFDSKPERIYIDSVNNRMARYIYYHAPILADMQQKEDFYSAWHFFYAIKKDERGEMPGCGDSFYLYLMKNYTLCKLCRKLKLDLLYNKIFYKSKNKVSR